MFNKAQSNSLEAIFGKVIAQHSIQIYLPKKFGKNDSSTICAQLYEYCALWFGAASTYEISMCFNTGKESHENMNVIEANFNDVGLKSLPDVAQFLRATCILFKYPGFLVKIDNELFFMKE